MYCAATAADCPFVAKKAQLMKMAKNRQCGPDETSCPAGCCPEANWFCCPDNMYCAATAADCPFVAKQAQLMKMANHRQWRPHDPLAAALRPTGSAALTTCTVLPPLLTAPLWPRTGSADLMRPHAPLAAALRPTGSAALTTCTVLPPLLTAPLSPRRPSS